jgi:IMP cyclohydrolase
VVDGTGESYIGIVRRDAVLVEAIEEPTLVATYEKDSPESIELEASDAEGMAEELYDLEFEHPVCAAAVTHTDAGFETGYYNGE